MKKKKALILPALIVAAAACWFAFKGYEKQHMPGHDKLVVSGNIEIVEAEVSFRIPGRVVDRRVDEGDEVKAGQVVASLDTTELEKQADVQAGDLGVADAALADLESGSRPEEIAAAAADVQRAKAALDKLLAGSRPEEVKAADAQVQAADAESDRVKWEYERARKLFDSGVISERELVAARTALEAIGSKKSGLTEQKNLVVEGPRKEDIAQARAALEQARQKYELVKQGPRKQTVEQARARRTQAQSALSLAKTRIDYAVLKSPMSGIVISKNVEPGEFVSPGTPVVTVGDLKNVFMRAYIDEADLGRVKIGQTVCISTDTYKGKQYTGRLSFVAPEAEFTPKNVQTSQERVKLVYRIKIAIPNPEMDLKPGMPADAAILLKAGETCR